MSVCYCYYQVVHQA